MLDNLSTSDNLVIFVYFAIVLIIGLLSSKKRDKTKEDYFLAGRNLGWFTVGVSLFATNISSEHIIGLAGAGATKGFVVGQFEWFAIFILIGLGWIFAPMFIRANVFTVPQLLGMKFGQKFRSYLTIISLVTYFFTKIAVTLLAGGYLLREVLKWDVFTSAVFLVLLTGIYVLVGGMLSVVRTQIFQTVILILGASILTFFGIKEIGGTDVLASSLSADYFSIFKPFNDPEFPWTGILLGAPILGIWYWCTDQYIVQRILSARSIEDAKKGTLLAAFLKFIPIFLFILPGMIAVILYPSVKGDEAFGFLLLGGLVPSGLKGFVIAGLFAALMSSLASAFNSSATLIAIDLYQPRRPNAQDTEIVLIGRLATTLIVLLTLLIIPLIKMMNAHLYISLQSVQAFISPPIVAVFLFGVFWKMSSKRAALITLLLGGAIGLLRIIFSFMPIPVFLDFEIINSFIRINFLHFAILLFLFSSSIMIFVSIYDNKYHREKSKIGSQELKNLEYQLAVPKFYEDKKSLKDFSNKPYLTKQTTSTTL